MYLEKIIRTKKDEVKLLSPLGQERTRSLHDPAVSLAEKPFITEIKRASPSAGEIKTDVDIVQQAREYAEGGAGAISVLTDEKYFRGSIRDLSGVADVSGIPLLCKDFIIDEIQVENAYRGGADFILLIAAVLDEGELERLSRRAADLGLKVLYEIHEFDEFRKIARLDPVLVGVNSRDLKTFRIEKEKAAGVIRQLKKEGSFMVVAESGIDSADDVRMLKSSGADAFLVGTVLMRSSHPAETLKELSTGLS